MLSASAFSQGSMMLFSDVPRVTAEVMTNRHTQFSHGQASYTRLYNPCVRSPPFSLFSSLPVHPVEPWEAKYLWRPQFSLQFLINAAKALNTADQDIFSDYRLALSDLNDTFPRKPFWLWGCFLVRTSIPRRGRDVERRTRAGWTYCDPLWSPRKCR